MDKPILNYRGFMQEDPSDRTRRICVPQIVDRNQTKTLADVVYGAIDRGLIAGLKPEAARSIADGIMTQLGETLNQGTGVLFGEYFSVRPYLSGTIKNMLAPLTADNKLRARFISGKAYNLDERNFSFHNVTQTEAMPKIAGVQPNVSGAAEFTFDVNEDLAVIGENLALGANDALKLYDCDGDEPAFIADVDPAKILVNSDGLLTVDKAGIAALASVVKAGFKVVKKIVVDGVEVEIESAMAEATKAEAPSGETPTITSAKTRGESEGSVNIAGGILDVVGQNLETATAVELWSDGATPALWQTVPATYADGKLTTVELDYDDKPSDGGTVRVTTAGGTASYAITYCAH